MTSSAGPTPLDGIDLLRLDGYVWSVRLLLATLEQYVAECGCCDRCIEARKLMARVEAWGRATDV